MEPWGPAYNNVEEASLRSHNLRSRAKQRAMGTAVAGIFVALLLSSTLASPYKRAEVGRTHTVNNFVGEGTNELATAILQGYVDLESNLAFSPLGYSALLAVLAEGARGGTRQQIANALHLPERTEVTRNAYKTVLERLHEKDSVSHPEFRNWFYIYKNFTVEPDFKAVLQQYYLTEVRDVDRLDMNAVTQQAEAMDAPESVQVVVDAPVQEESMNEMKPDRQESDDSMTSEKLKDPILPEDGKETIIPAESNEGDNMSEKVENPMTSSKLEEIMQVSEDDVDTKRNKGGPLKIVFPIPFPEKLKMRKMYDEREASPSGAVMTMQEEMLGTKEESADDKKKDERIEGMKHDMIDDGKKEEMKEKESLIEDKQIANDDKKKEKLYEIKDEIKHDKIEEDKNMDVNKEEKKDDKLVDMKYDKIEAMKDDKMEAMKDDKVEGMKDDKMEAMKDDKMEAMKDDKMEGMKDDKTEAMKMEAMKDDKMEAMKDDKMEGMKEDKMEAMKDNKMEGIKDDKMEAIKDDKMEAMKDDKMEGMKDDKMEAIKEDKMEAMKDEKMEAMKDDKMEAMKDDKMEGMKEDKMEAMKDNKMEGIKDDKMEAIKDDKMEAMKDDKMEGMKDDKMEAIKEDKMEAMKGEMLIDENKENDKKVETPEGVKNEMIKDDSREEEIMTKGKDKESEAMMAGNKMVVAERKARHLGLSRLSRRSLQPGDVISSISSNNIKSKPVSQLLIFNGMYFKGTWATPFRDQKDSFYKSDSEKSTVTMMNTKGKFRVGNVPELDSVAIELPYKGDRYSLLVLIPNGRSGLSQLTSDLAGYSLTNIQKHLQIQEVEVCLPRFEIQTTTRPIEALNKFGVTDIFSKEKADLTSISKDLGLFVEELVQHVTVKVDNSTSSYNHISAGNPSARSGLLKLTVDHPFLYFVRDTEESLIIVAGKVTDPSSLPKKF
ncbi:hypothetical protein B7P43_G10403 [Cryptotermes secundus]|uniref:Serpin domain-containing protein n=1 Tax=Cryptotermes secundus TaxID=105785 RepID=A0A2J7QEN0_9NEOP|nr:hypothetical protein B7P43_G10403 [Cryptotermes secundus]